MNNGPPMHAVITPTGSICGEMTVIEIRWDARRRSDPSRPYAGIRYLLSAPMSVRAMWGATRPTNPMTPVKLTTVAAMNVRTRRITSLFLSTSTPSIFALSSPTPITLSWFAMVWIYPYPRTVTSIMIAMAV